MVVDVSFSEESPLTLASLARETTDELRTFLTGAELDVVGVFLVLLGRWLRGFGTLHRIAQGLRERLDARYSRPGARCC